MKTLERNWLIDPLKRYVAVGSRETPENILVVQFHVGKVMCDLGFQGSSGLAPGSDEHYYEGAKQSSNFDKVGFINYIPWDGFGSSKTSLIKHTHDPNKLIFTLKHSPFKERAKWLAIGARGNDHGLNSASILLQARNTHQVLGVFLNNKPNLLHCYAKPVGKTGMVRGGTNTAVMLARHFKVPVINLAIKEDLERTLLFLQRNGVNLNRNDYFGENGDVLS